MLPACLLGLTGHSSRMPAIRSRLFWLLPAALLAGGYGIGIFASSQTAPAVVRTLELVIVGIYASSLYRESRRDPQLPGWILASIVLAYGIGLARFGYTWLVLDEPRAHPWKISAPGFFHLRNLGLIAAPAIIIIGDCIRRLFDARSLPPAHRRQLLIAACAVQGVAWTGLIWSGSRAGTLVALLGLLVVCFHAIPARRWRAMTAFTATFLFGAVAAMPFLPNQSGFGLMRMIGQSSLREHSASEVASGRLELWQDVLRRLQESPWLGLGPDQYQHQDGLLKRVFEVHNLWLQSWTEGGMPALIGILGLTLVAAWKLLPRLARPGYLCPLLLLLFFVYGLVDGVSYWPLSLVIIAGLFAGLPVAGRATPGVPTASPLSHMVCFAGRAVAVAAAAVTFGTIAFLSWHYRHPPTAPDSPTSQLVRQFPLYTFGYDNWIEAWHRDLQRDVEADYRWLTQHSRTPFHARIQLARYLAGQQEFAKALEALDAGIATAPANFLKRNEAFYAGLRRALQERILASGGDGAKAERPQRPASTAPEFTLPE